MLTAIEASRDFSSKNFSAFVCGNFLSFAPANLSFASANLSPLSANENAQHKTTPKKLAATKSQFIKPTRAF